MPASPTKAASDSPVLLHYQSRGEPTTDQADVVILHGLFGDGENWRSQADKLTSHFRVHLLDLRNHGSSPHTTHMSYDAMAADVVFTCKHIGVSSIHLIGHSMGGKTAMRIASVAPNLLQSLIIVDIAPRHYPHHHQRIIEGLLQLQTHRIDSRRAANETLSRYVENAGIRSFLLKNLRRDADGSYQLRINLNTIAAEYENIASAVASSNPFTKPTLFIKGSDSDYLGSEDQPLVLEMFPAARLKIVGGAGHWPHSEKPEVVHKIISDFLLS